MLSRKALQITPSPTLAIDSRAKQMKNKGIDVIGFGAGEPDFDTPEHIKAAAVEAINQNFTRYTPASGIPELKAAICCKLHQENGLEYETEQIIISNGAKHSLDNVFRALLNPGDEVIIPAPFWVSYPELVKINDGKAVLLETRPENKYKALVADLKGVLTPRTKALVLNSPCNPTGQVYSREELSRLAAFAVENGIVIVSDEVYEKFIYGEQEHVSIASLGGDIKKLTVTVNGVSKTYAMTGWRIGYTASEGEIAKTMAGLQSHTASNPNSIAQKAALAAVSNSQDCVEEMRKAFAGRRDYMVQRINDMPYISCIEPEGAFYLFADLSAAFSMNYEGRPVESSANMAALLLEHHRIAIVPGEGFGAPDFARLSYATSLDNIRTGLDRLEAFLDKLG